MPFEISSILKQMENNGRLNLTTNNMLNFITSVMVELNKHNIIDMNVADLAAIFLAKLNDPNIIDTHREQILRCSELPNSETF